MITWSFLSGVMFMVLTCCDYVHVISHYKCNVVNCIVIVRGKLCAFCETTCCSTVSKCFFVTSRTRHNVWIMKEIIVIRNTKNVTTTNKKSPADDIGERCHLKYSSFLFLKVYRFCTQLPTNVRVCRMSSLNSIFPV